MKVILDPKLQLIIALKIVSISLTLEPLLYNNPLSWGTEISSGLPLFTLFWFSQFPLIEGKKQLWSMENINRPIKEVVELAPKSKETQRLHHDQSVQ